MENASKALIIAGAILISILLISIGIILINSGRDITETGTAGMQSQKIQTFNNQFTAYEGIRKGSEIKNLANLVNSSNAVDPEHQVTLFASVSGGPVRSIGDISNSQSYEVKVHYATSTTGSAVSDVSSGTILAGFRGQYNQRKTEPGYIEWILIKNPD